MIGRNLNLDLELKKTIVRLGGQMGTIHLKDPSRDALHLAASHNLPESFLERVREIAWGKGMTGLAAKRARPVPFPGPRGSSPSEIEAEARLAGVPAAIVAPMLHGKDVVGTIGIGFHVERRLGSREVAWLIECGRKLAHRVMELRKAA